MSLHELVYVSLAEHAMAEGELQAMLASFQAYNREHGITGLLIYRDQEFMQLIEGEAGEVRRLFARIERDPRHRQVDRLWDGPIAARSCTEWAMGFSAPDDAQLHALPDSQQVLDDGLFVAGRASAGKRFLLLLRDELLRQCSPQARLA